MIWRCREWQRICIGLGCECVFDTTIEEGNGLDCRNSGRDQVKVLEYGAE